MGEKSGQPLLGFTSRSGGGIELASDVRCVDSQQLNTPDPQDIDCVAIDNVAHHHRRRAALRDRWRWGEKPHGKRERNELTGGLRQADKRGRSHAGVICKPASTAFKFVCA